MLYKKWWNILKCRWWVLLLSLSCAHKAHRESKCSSCVTLWRTTNKILRRVWPFSARRTVTCGPSPTCGPVGCMGRAFVVRLQEAHNEGSYSLCVYSAVHDEHYFHHVYFVLSCVLCAAHGKQPLRRAFDIMRTAKGRSYDDCSIFGSVCCAYSYNSVCAFMLPLCVSICFGKFECNCNWRCLLKQTI
jgi:hypothetical protein